MKDYHKLIRDNIPEIITSKGETAETHMATEEEFRQKIDEKLQEEVTEYLKSHDADELADLLEVIYAAAELDGLTEDELNEARQLKADERGRFARRIILDRS